jgi:peptide/nickel transport system permease protein
MTAYVARRLLLAGVTVWLISIGVFILLRLSSCDQILVQQGRTVTPESIAASCHELGLDKPLPIQYLHWAGQIATGDLGKSTLTQVSISEEFRSRFPVSLELMLLTVAWVGLLGIGLGCVAARWRNSTFDYVVRLIAGLGLSLPVFWVATLVLMLPAQLWQYAPPLGTQTSILENPLDNLRQFLPASLVLAIGPSALVLRLTRSGVLGVMSEDYIRTARSKGLSERVILFRHALRNVLSPIVTVMGLLIVDLLAGSLVIENVFALRGLGSYILEALLQKDYYVVQSLAIYTAAVAVFLNLCVDMLYGALDPRVRYPSP